MFPDVQAGSFVPTVSRPATFIQSDKIYEVLEFQIQSSVLPV